ERAQRAPGGHRGVVDPGGQLAEPPRGLHGLLEHAAVADVADDGHQRGLLQPLQPGGGVGVARDGDARPAGLEQRRDDRAADAAAAARHDGDAVTAHLVSTPVVPTVRISVSSSRTEVDPWATAADERGTAAWQSPRPFRWPP